MDIVFVNDVNFNRDFEHPQIGQLILHQILHKKYTSTYVNFDFLNMKGILPYCDSTDKNIIQCGEYILSFTPKIVGFYTMCNSFVFAIQIAEYIKKKDPSIKIVFGGPHASLTAENCLMSFEFIDVICIGESELVIEPLVKALLDGTDLGVVGNLAFRQNGNVHFTDTMRLLTSEELGEYTVFDYSPVDFAPGSTFELEGGRGCPYSCTFCSTSIFWGRNCRLKPVPVIVNEMNTIYQRYGITSFSISHDMFTAKRRYIEEFAYTLINNNYNYKWHCSARVDSLDRDLIELMRKSGCESIYLGIETGSPRMQKLINKNIAIDTALMTIAHMQQLGYKLTTSFIYCLPNEEVRDFEDTLKMIERLLLLNVDSVQLHRFMPLPATAAWESVKEQLKFDENLSDISIFHKGDFSHAAIEMIKSNPALFSQFYSVSSPIDEKYPNFDFFIIILSSLRHSFCYSIQQVVQYFGLYSIYLSVKDNLSEGQKVYKSLKSYDECYIDEINRMLNHLFLPCIEKLFLKIPVDNWCEVYKYEKIRHQYMQEAVPDMRVFDFEIDMERFLHTGLLIPKKTYIRFSKKGNDVKITKMAPIYGVLQEKLK